MKNKYFYTRTIWLTEDYYRRLGNKAYDFLSEANPQSIEQVPLLKIGICLQLDELSLQFSSHEFLTSVQNRLKKLGQYDWMRFSEVTGIPDVESIRPAQSEGIVRLISNHLSNNDWGEEGIPTDLRNQIRRSLDSLTLCYGICGLFNRLELIESKDWLATHTVDEGNPITMAFVGFHKAVTNILEAWYLSAGMDIPQVQSAPKTDAAEAKPLIKFPDLDQHKKTVVPLLVKKLFTDGRIAVAEIYPEGVSPKSDRGKHLRGALVSTTGKAARRRGGRVTMGKQGIEGSEETEEIIIYSPKNA